MRKNGNKKLHERYWDFTVEYGKMVKETAEFIVDEYKKCEDDNCDLDELVSNEVDDSLIYYSSQWTILEENATPDECGEAYQQALEAYWDDVYEEVQAQIDEMDESYKPVRRPHKRMREARNLSEAKKYTQKDIKEHVRLGKATDITNWSFEKINDLLKERDIELVGSSFGVNGMNGGLYRDADTGELFAVCARSSSLFQMPY